MAFPSLPLYVDPPNWNQQDHSLVVDAVHHHRPPPQSGVDPVRPGSMAELARQAKIPQPEAALRCPRCDSNNTKFCYFNNYSLSQPRHFCKTCRRYWTRGGALRSVPVGGGCRRNKRSSKSSATPTSSSFRPQAGIATPSSLTAASATPESTENMNLMFPVMSTPLAFSSPWQQLQDYGLERWRIEQVQQTAQIPPATNWGGMEVPATAAMHSLNNGELCLGFGCSNAQGRQFWSAGAGGGGGGGGGSNGNGGGWSNTTDI